MLWRVEMALLATALAGCQGCGHGGGGVDVQRIPPTDAFHGDAAIPSADVPPTSAWADGSLVLPRHAVAALSRNACGGARPLVSAVWRPDAHSVCAHEGYLYFSSTGEALRTRLPDPAGAVETLTPTDPTTSPTLVGTFGCQTDSILLAAGCIPCRADALIRFTDVTRPGAVLWSNQRGPWQSIAAQGGFWEFAASDQLLAWIYQQPDGPRQIYVAGPNGESPRVLPTSPLVLDLHAAQNHLVWSDNGDIMLWTVGTDAPENLTHDAPAQAWPWIDGNRVVWADQRNGPGTIDSPNNPDIYGMDLTTRTPTRLNQDPADQPAMQYFPVLAGDWVVWMDTRHASTPNPGQYGIADVTELYGYNWVTQHEYPVMSGAIRATSPVIVGTDVYFPCSPPPAVSETSSLFTTPLPTP